MKKRSFFERLAGGLRFDDSEEETSTTDAVEQNKNLVRELSPKVDAPTTQEQAPQPVQEEVGELPVDVYETSSEIIIQTLIAGVLPDNLSITITRDMVTIKGKREENKAIPADQYVMRELYWGSFARAVELPAEVEIDTSEAIERHGMLMIKLPKADRGRKAVLKIKSI